MSIYMRREQVKPGVLVKSKSFSGDRYIPAIIVSWFDEDFVRVLDIEGERCMMNVLYLEAWKTNKKRT